MTHVVLNKLDVARAAAKAYLEGRLSAQGPTPVCSYRDASGCPCVIGASVDDKTAKKWDDLDDSGVIDLKAQDILESDDMQALAELQCLHDEWAAGSSWAESRLVSLLNSILPADEQIACRSAA
jgi:hypothetical protein